MPATEVNIEKKVAIEIRIQNLVKIYNRDNRILREWKGGKKVREKFSKNEAAVFNYQDLIWQIPLLGYLVYLCYFYMENSFWQFVFPHILFFYTFNIFRPLNEFATKGNKVFLKKTFKVAFPLFLWGFPLFNLIWFYFEWQNVAVVVLIAVLWYALIAFYLASVKIKKQEFNPDSIKGRLAGVRRGFYKLVSVTPFFGRKKEAFKALNGVSLTIENGMFGLLGPNGAGKSTLMKILTGILDQSYGKIWINDYDTLEKREELQGIIGYLPQEFNTYENLTSYEFLSYMAILKNITDKTLREERINHVLSAVNMLEHKHERIGSFSGGMKQRIGIAQILLHLPKILIVDEPTSGLDPRERIRFRNLLVELSKNRVVIFSTHIIEDIASSCNRVAVLNKGKLKYLGKPSEMAEAARNKVWMFEVDEKEFLRINRQLQVIHHMNDGKKVRVRCLALEQPYPGAKNVTPLLEDSYLWLLKERKNEN